MNQILYRQNKLILSSVEKVIIGRRDTLYILSRERRIRSFSRKVPNCLPNAADSRPLNDGSRRVRYLTIMVLGAEGPITTSDLRWSI